MTVNAAEWVGLTSRFTPGWPWPPDSYGLDPMFGPEGWCRGCGTPLVEQSGALVLEGRKFPTAAVWVPNWRFDVVCISAELASEVASRFRVDLGDVHKPRTGPTGAKQLRAAVTSHAWYDPENLAKAVVAHHHRFEGERTGTTCARCARWKWLPVAEHEAPIIGAALDSDRDLIASPEVFGDGLQSFRHLLFRKELAEYIVAAAPRIWTPTKITIA